ncbi:uncharacterized protein EHS24_007481 [Apiotrichum porosum]|uniref:Arf-GAP domain-containing protein n=1 Tax=Apiotrichum porosum TaxID=105984 RepID=A0A427XUT4_9TREE|nr:uncharacterized protein EHS24_007481 [Apiotrichum porosum]RSH82501.1 hypothetical protein EHS24_007481 [Apiotrichum porosum]
MSRQDKATTERNARILRDLVRQPDNKACADCRKNDARWASWNLGVYLCIRCSGMHRAMGTHISKVKSIDLDIWTPEQMESIQKWGNRRANLYWERHLKKGHVPPDHKIESFIRSKYESRRWAMDGPPPRDPATLEDGAAASPSASSPPPPAAQTSRPTPTAAPVAGPTPASRGAHPLLSRQAKPGMAAPAPARATPIIDLFGDDTPVAAPVTTAAPAAPAAAPVSPATTAAAAPPPTSAAPPSNIFDLDFKAPAAPAARQQTAKADIMSLFSQPSSQQQQQQPVASGGFFNASAAPVAANPYGSWNGGITSSSPPQSAPTQAPVSNWGGFNDQAAWGSPVAAAAPPQQAQQNLWGAPAAASSAAADPWAAASAPAAAPAPKKDERDPFANIWG